MDSLVVGSSRRGGVTVPVTLSKLDEIERATIVTEESVEVVSLLVVHLGITAVSCDSTE